MSRWPFLFEYLIDVCELLDTGTAMLDGSYWKDDDEDGWGDLPEDRASEPEIGGGE